MFGSMVLGFAPAAQASVPSGDIVDVVVIPGSSSVGDSATLTVCNTVNVYGYVGKTICEFSAFYYVHSGGSREYFYIGTNYAVWHAWQGSGGWKSLGGKASRFIPNGAYPAHDTGYEGVRTVGTDNWTSWCRFNVHGTWTPWDDAC
ncbi:hypothetical protein ACIA5D_49875 [Actinoplanes sp. NPDC051513]|uniref:hypothetical protein n=1 Tax=Actinoplanes sp. NPDC051513 TaxID=3363908 RepID=UPI0037A8AC61